MWQPKEEGVKELMNILEESSSTNNQIQSEVFNVNLNYDFY